MYNSNLDNADNAVDQAIDLIGDLAEKHAEQKELFDELIMIKEKIEPVHDLLDDADDEMEKYKAEAEDLGDPDDLISGYDEIETGFGTVFLKCDNENDRQLFNALLDCLKQPNVNRNDLHEYLHERAGLMAGFHS
jgi:hypothetical protein